MPQRVVSLSPTHTEIMFAIGAGDQLVAVDDFSNYPPEALELPHDLSYQAWAPSLSFTVITLAAMPLGAVKGCGGR